MSLEDGRHMIEPVASRDLGINWKINVRRILRHLSLPEMDKTSVSLKPFPHCQTCTSTVTSRLVGTPSNAYLLCEFALLKPRSSCAWFSYFFSPSRMRLELNCPGLKSRALGITVRFHRCYLVVFWADITLGSRRAPRSHLGQSGCHALVPMGRQ